MRRRAKWIRTLLPWGRRYALLVLWVLEIAVDALLPSDAQTLIRLESTLSFRWRAAGAAVRSDALGGVGDERMGGCGLI